MSSDDACAGLCTLLLTACLDVCAGIYQDFATTSESFSTVMALDAMILSMQLVAAHSPYANVLAVDDAHEQTTTTTRVIKASASL